MWARILCKIFSGRFLVTVGIVVTYCAIMLLSMILVSQGKMDMPTFMGMFTAFALISREIAQSYFVRNDRKKEGENHDEENPKPSPTGPTV